MDEKGAFLKTAVDNEFVLFLEHDAHNELCTIRNTEKGERLNELFSFKDLFD
jgi:beta-galactosidase beta subunit